jgi:hypothetical protein
MRSPLKNLMILSALFLGEGGSFLEHFLVAQSRQQQQPLLLLLLKP